MGQSHNIRRTHYQLSDADRSFLGAFEACEVELEDFDHRAHVVLAYSYLAERDTDSAIDAMRDALHAFLDHNHIDPTRYHETLTRAWIMAVKHFMAQAGRCESSGELISRYPQMLNSKIMLSHYSAELLFSNAARASFVEPDIEPIPRYDG